MVVKKFGYRIVPYGALQQIGYVIVSRSGVVRDRKPSVRVISTVTAIWSFDSNCLGVIWSSLTGN
ncbi:AICAR transformylase/IMP cyclohydrolase PurH [Pseudomonas syringae pv. actinidiae]|uniref:AICAR transformylase/IMP cyclohydrolase PurH n=1 Tax=Pseudomonas syringae pv. actinidiae TaxID=103796 RepID=A0A2V0QH16_PSESF|nr:AICAR transformylase/IMP cyclohydrolase PurH [Pseudomonas syringae pv. actinidiae]GBH07870.1 AICAR transformylase/IMP cyclohydrolase PurH [Pseudomonas syringae pv. actinidiae]